MVITTLQARIPAVALDGVTKTYGGAGAEVVRALDAVSMAFESGTFSAIMGASGSGKTTLLQCAAGLDRPDRGTVRIGATDLTVWASAGWRSCAVAASGSCSSPSTCCRR